MDIILLAIGKTNTSYLQTGIDEYKKRLTRYVSFKLEYLPDLRNTKSLSEAEQKNREGKLFTDYFQSSDHVVLLDEHGKERTSMEFASYLEKRLASGKKRLIFCIGGPYGFSDEVHARADEKVSLSKMTFNHEMVRLFFIEQIYRGCTILRGEPYHHE
jgi:23S rRNA (pseudouridine1915-N3)-methyltransferase